MLARSLLQVVGEVAREMQVLLALRVQAWLVGGAAEAMAAHLAAGPVVAQRRGVQAALGMVEGLQHHQWCARFLLEQAGFGGIGDEDPVRLHGDVLGEVAPR